MKDNLETLFEDLKHEFDTEQPDFGHENRFLNKLNKKQTTKPVRRLWRPFISIAASVAFLISFFLIIDQKDAPPSLASISPELAQNASVFNVKLQSELQKINAEEYPEHQELIVDALFEIKVLEEDYKQLLYGLKENPESELIISAMILNFQSRIDVLQDVMDIIESSKQTTPNNTTLI